MEVMSIPLLIRSGWLNRYSPSGFSFSSSTRLSGPVRLNSGISVCANTQGVLSPTRITLRDQNRWALAKGPKQERTAGFGDSNHSCSITSTRKSPALFRINNLVSELESNSHCLHASTGSERRSPSRCQSRLESEISGTTTDGFWDDRLESGFDCKGINYRGWREWMPPLYSAVGADFAVDYLPTVLATSAVGSCQLC